MTRKKLVGKVLFYASVILLCLLWMVPLFFCFFTSIKSNQGFYSQPVFVFPSKIAWENYSYAFGIMQKYIINDIIVCLLKVPLGILVATLAAFALTRLHIKHSTTIFCFFLLGMMIPRQISLVPLNIMINTLNLRNTYTGLFFVYTGFGIAFGLLILRGFMRSIPNEIDESAYIDGASSLQLLTYIILPVCLPAISTLVILDFLSTWNEFMIQSVLITNDNMRTVPTGLLRFQGEAGVNYPLMCAGVLIAILPTFLVYIIFQKYFVEGISGSIKG